MKVIVDKNIIEVNGIYSTQVQAEGYTREALRVDLAGDITREQLESMTNNIWELVDGEEIVGTCEGFNTLVKHEAVFAKVQTKQEEIDEAIAGAENTLAEITGGAVAVGDTDAAAQYRAAIESLIDDLDDSIALTVPVLYAEWNDVGEYEVGNRVRYNGVLYKCLQAHTAQATWTPNVVSSLWAKVLIEDYTTVPAWTQPDSTNPYMIGDKVTHNDKTWVSTVDNNVWEPGTAGVWEETV